MPDRDVRVRPLALRRRPELRAPRGGRLRARRGRGRHRGRGARGARASGRGRGPRLRGPAAHRRGGERLRQDLRGVRPLLHLLRDPLHPRALPLPFRRGGRLRGRGPHGRRRARGRAHRAGHRRVGPRPRRGADARDAAAPRGRGRAALRRLGARALPAARGHDRRTRGHDPRRARGPALHRHPHPALLGARAQGHGTLRLHRGAARSLLAPTHGDPRHGAAHHGHGGISRRDGRGGRRALRLHRRAGVRLLLRLRLLAGGGHPRRLHGRPG